MAITLKVIGNGHFQGAETNLAGYSATEDATPIDASDSSGGTGTANFTVSEDGRADGTILLRGDTIEVEDGSNGRTQGLVSSVDGSKGEATIGSSSRLNALVVDCLMPSFTGTLEAAFRAYLAVGGVVSGIVVSPEIASREVAYPAWTGNLWDHLKKLCAAEQVEISLVSSNVVLRPLRGRIVETVKNEDERWSVSDGALAQNIEIYYYNNKFNSSALLYPDDQNSPDTSVIQVGEGETSVTEVKIAASIRGIQQPQAVDFVPQYYTGLSSVYSVLDGKDVPLPVSEWYGAGGNITVVAGEDLQSLIITVTGPNLVERGPFKIAGAVLENEAYSSLRIVGSAIETSKTLLTLPTGMPASRTGQVVGITVDNPFISSITQAYTCGLIVAGKFAGAQQELSVSATVVNRKDAPGSVRYPLFSEFNAEWSTKTFAQFNAAHTADTFDDLTAEYFAKVADTFENQAFGNVAGARVRFREAFYRIRSSTITHDIISYSAERDTLFEDFNSVWSGETFTAFNSRMSGKTFEDFGVIPLWQ